MAEHQTEKPDRKVEPGPDRNEEQLNNLLKRWQEGDDEAYDELFILLHEDLARLAHFQFSRERQGHTLQTGDLVNKLYLKMRSVKNASWKDHDHFRRTAVRTMRQILIDHARGWIRRPTGKDKLAIDGLDVDQMREMQQKDEDLLKLLAISQAIEKMARLDPEMAEIAYLKLVVGHSLHKIADLMSLDINKVKREWQIIRKFVEPSLWE